MMKSNRRTTTKTLSVLYFLLIVNLCHGVNITYVTPSDAGVEDGSSWINALPGDSLQHAINKTATLPGGGQVWLAAG